MAPGFSCEAPNRPLTAAWVRAANQRVLPDAPPAPEPPDAPPAPEPPAAPPPEPPEPPALGCEPDVVDDDPPLDLSPETEVRDLTLVDEREPPPEMVTEASAGRRRMVVRVVVEEPLTTTPGRRYFLTTVTRLDGRLGGAQGGRWRPTRREPRKDKPRVWTAVPRRERAAPSSRPTRIPERIRCSSV